MENDDKPIGQILNRRDALKVLGIGSAAFLAACAAPKGPAPQSQQREPHKLRRLQAQCWTVLCAPS